MKSAYRAQWYHRYDDKHFECDLCPRRCRLQPGQKGFCFVREADDQGIVLTTYGRSSGFCIDPIEKKPLHHFLPGSSVLSFGTAGCNLGCKFCQNWDISKARDQDRLTSEASPRAIAEAAVESQCRSVAFTYNDPSIFAEYAVDTARECRSRGIKTVAVTAGYICPEARAEFFEPLDAANIDLKAFTDDFYQKFAAAHLRPVLETLEYVAKNTRTWLEVTTLLIPGANDSDAELEGLTKWLRDHVGPDVPLHFSAFHPDFKLQDRPPTPPETLLRAREVALRSGIKFVYTGNIRGLEGQHTDCANCGHRLIARNTYDITGWGLTSGNCQRCQWPLPGVFEEAPGRWGNRRLPISIPLAKSN